MSNDKQVSVVVNGTAKAATKGQLTFEQVVELGFPNNPVGNPNILYTLA